MGRKLFLTCYIAPESELVRISVKVTEPKVDATQCHTRNNGYKQSLGQK